MYNAIHKKLFPLAGSLLVFPAAWFVLISILKYQLGFAGLYNISAPLLNSWGIHEPMGWNINLLILAGPVFALVLNVLGIASEHFNPAQESFDSRASLRRNWWGLAVIVCSSAVLIVMFVYLLMKNI